MRSLTPSVFRHADSARKEGVVEAARLLVRVVIVRVALLDVGFHHRVDLVDVLAHC